MEPDSPAPAGLPPEQYLVKGGKLRPSQLITTFGPGAVVDLPEDSVMIAGIDHWPRGVTIHEPRLEAALDIQEFRAPAVKKFDGDVPCVRFPRTLICSNYGHFGRRKRCAVCDGDTYPARLIVICAAGHADDFPWEWWVHRGDRCSGRPALRIENQGRTAALADLIVHCSTCNRRASLSGALGQGMLSHFKCSGQRPWLPGARAQACTERPRSVLRGASNVYFSSILSALSIPPWTSPIHSALCDHWPTLRDLPEHLQRSIIQALPAFAGYHVDDVLRAIQERLANTTSATSLRQDEYRAFRNPGAGVSTPDFETHNEPVPAGFANHITQVVLAARLREVRVLRGFTRIDPPDSENGNQALTAIAQNPQPWLPAVEHRGEGIFIELPLSMVTQWEARPAVQRRTHDLEQAYNNWRRDRGMPPAHQVLPRFVMVHTLAHLLIRQLSLDCGYSSSSLRERIYAGPDMCGLLIYTASADSDGSLGGLVQQGRSERAGATLRALLENAQWCSSDPLCSEHQPLQTGKLTGAACHACTLVSETSCEYANRLLDRAMIRDLVAVNEAGYFS